MVDHAIGMIDMILPKERDYRLVTIRRGGTRSDENHRLLAMCAATSAEPVLSLYETVSPYDKRPHLAIAGIRAWASGTMSMMEARAAGGHAMAAARSLTGAARFAAFAAGQAAVVSHVPEHELGAAAYTIKAVRETERGEAAVAAGRRECHWQHTQLPNSIRALVLDDQRHRNSICWNACDFDDDSQDSAIDSRGDRRRAIVDIEFAEYVDEVRLDCGLTDV